MADIGTQARRDIMAQALRTRGYMAAADQCQSKPDWEGHYAVMLSSVTPPLTELEHRAIYPWNDQED